MLVASPIQRDVPAIDPNAVERVENERVGSSSPEPSLRHSTTTRDGIKIPSFRGPSAPSFEYSGDEVGPYSDLSDTPPQSLQQSGLLQSLTNRKTRQQVAHHQTPYAAPLAQQQSKHQGVRSASRASDVKPERHTEERVIWHGYLLYLKSKGGVRQWKRTWVVLRPKNLAFYKNDEVSIISWIIESSLLLSIFNRSTPQISYCLYRVLSMQWRLILFRRAKTIACRSSRKKRAIASVRLAKTPWRSGLEL